MLKEELSTFFSQEKESEVVDFNQYSKIKLTSTPCQAGSNNFIRDQRAIAEQVFIFIASGTQHCLPCFPRLLCDLARQTRLIDNTSNVLYYSPLMTLKV